MSAANGVVLYDGPSMIDGGPIVVILTWHSTNRKTGGACSASGPRQCVAGKDCMAQTWILRADADPVESLAADTDASICGSCVHRGRIDDATGKRVERSCYVNVGQGPLSVWRSWRAGNYPVADVRDVAAIVREHGRAVRFGAYGDPGAVPLSVWLPLRDAATVTTGYTHQWRALDGAWSSFLMASGDTVADRADARRDGWRTFYVAPRDGSGTAGAIECLSDSRGLSCIDCGACAGRKGRDTVAVDVYIRAHGAGAKHVDARS